MYKFIKEGGKSSNELWETDLITRNLIDDYEREIESCLQGRGLPSSRQWLDLPRA